MAFFDPEGAGSVACRAYLVTAEQFADVAAQEMRLEPGGEFAQALASVLPDVGELHRMGPGRYETVVRVDTRDGRSAPDGHQRRHPAGSRSPHRARLPAVDRDRVA